MALRYLAYQGRNSPGHPGPPPGLKEVFRSETVAIFANAEVIALPGQAGIIVGHLFSRTIPSSRIQKLPAEDSIKIIDTGGSALLSQFWGGYVAFLKLPEGDIVIRDPSGTVPCYYAPTLGGWVVASDMDLLAETLPAKPSPDWDALLRHLASGEFRRPETALHGVTELLAGFRLLAGADVQVITAWSPWDHIGGASQSDRDAATRLLVVSDSTIRAWGDCFNAVGVSLSGGLDSSIVAAGLRERPNNLTLLNMAGDDAESDERAYARLAAEVVGVRLTEAFYDLADIDFARATSAYLPRPVFGGLARADMAIKQRVEAAEGLDAWFGGLGGDNVFCLMQSTTPVLDRLHLQGLSPRVLSTLIDVMDLTGCSLWQALKQMRRTAKAFRGRYALAPQPSLLNFKKLANTKIDFNHAWLDAPKGTPIGKTVHVAMLQRIQAATDGFPRSGAPLILPLLSQPIVEMCLSIPTWQWCAGGHNRAVARRAYSSVLPEPLVYRRSKGGPSRFAYAAVDSQRSKLKELLLGGLLAQQELIDVTSIEDLVSSTKPIPAEHYVRLTMLAEAEVWARHWS